VWRNDDVGQVGLRLPESQAELVLSTNLLYAVNWLVTERRRPLKPSSRRAER
jgi:hypothetical protein